MKKTVVDLNGEHITFREPFLRKHLTITTEPYVLSISKAVGELDLLKLAKNGIYEAGWVYSHDTSTWYNETKRYEERKVNDRIARGSVKYAFDYFQLGRVVTQYHTHPRHFQELAVRDFFLSNPRNDYNERWIDFFASNVGKLPGREDVVTQTHILGESNPRTVIDFMIVSQFGFTNIRHRTRTPKLELAERYIAIRDKVLEETFSLGITKEELIIDNIISGVNCLLPDIILSFRTAPE